MGGFHGLSLKNKKKRRNFEEIVRKCQNSQEETGEKRRERLSQVYLVSVIQRFGSHQEVSLQLLKSSFSPPEGVSAQIRLCSGFCGFISIILPFIAPPGARAEALTEIWLLLGADDDISAHWPIGLTTVRFLKQEPRIHIRAP